MKNSKLYRSMGAVVLAALLALGGCSSEEASQESNAEESQQEAPQAEQVNTLTSQEKEEGWVLLFDGETTNGWRGVYKEAFPEKGWKVEDGLLKVVASGGGESEFGGDIITENQYGNFEFSLEFKLTEGANSGIKYFVKEIRPRPEGSAIGLEYQLIDDSRPDVEGTWTLASLYELYRAENKQVNPIGEFNKARIIARGDRVEHWLNGVKVLEYTRGSEEFRQLVSESKYSDYENFGEAEEGHILLQDHGHEVAFRNIKIREIDLNKN
ncbi:3-keto-disaccharide hydrolase [Fodinibius sediminis]|uniref:3-keto-disaccharide hydrolase n=1 Tax=Fodinibius sediminis TaxID=1214077 RepID=UPI003D9C9533